MKPIKFTLLLFVIAFGFTACKQTDEKETAAIDTLKTTEIKSPDSIRYVETYPVDSLLTTKILPPGTFHNDEVEPNADKINWIGLFKGKDGFYLSSTKIKLENIYDAVLDEDESQKTGWEVTTDRTDSCYILIEPMPYLKAMPVREAPLKKEINPKEKVTFQYLGIEYTIFAVGGIRYENQAPAVYNYKLYLTAIINGQKVTDLLVSTPIFDDNMIQILFAGDIDGDQKLDLIIDTSCDYNAVTPTLYLSKPSDEGHLVKPVGSHTSVGC